MSPMEAEFPRLELRENSTNALWRVYMGTKKQTEGASSPSDENSTVVIMLNTAHPIYRLSLTPPKNINPDAQVSSKKYKLRYSMMERSAEALRWLQQNPHPSLLPVQDIRYVYADGSPIEPSKSSSVYAPMLFAPLSSTTLDPVSYALPMLCPTEMLYGLTKIVDGLQHLHDRGMAHWNLSWASVYVGHSSARQKYWVIGDPHFMIHRTDFAPFYSPGDSVVSDQNAEASSFNAELFRDFVTELRGLRTQKGLSYTPGEVKNPYSASQIDWRHHPVGAVDMYSFGVMLEEVINSDKVAQSRFKSATPTYSCGSTHDSAWVHAQSPKATVDSLLKFAKRCQQEDPLKRPAAKDFFGVPCVQHCVLVQMMRSLDTLDSMGDREKQRFFLTLHYELYKIPYEVLVRRVIPRLLNRSLWLSPLAYPLVVQLLTPLPKRVQQPPGGVLVVPLSTAQRETLPLLMERYRDVAVLAQKTQPNEAKESSECDDKGRGGPVGVPQGVTDPFRVPVYGVLGWTEYSTAMGGFLGDCFDSLGLPSSLTFLLLRHTGRYIAGVSFSHVVVPRLLPFLRRALRDSCSAVVMEALRSYAIVARAVLGAQTRAAKVEAAVEELRHTAHAEIFSLAVTERQSVDIRLSALSMLVKMCWNLKSLGVGRETAIAAICANLAGYPIRHLVEQISSSGVNSEKFVLGSDEGAPAIATDQQLSLMDCLEIIAAALHHLRQHRQRMLPIDVAYEVLPALLKLIERLRTSIFWSTATTRELTAATASNTPGANGNNGRQEPVRADEPVTPKTKARASIPVHLERLYQASMSIARQLYSTLDESQNTADAENSEGAQGEMVPPCNSVLLSDNDDESLRDTRANKSSTVREPGTTTASTRAPVSVDKDGWCKVRDPSVFSHAGTIRAVSEAVPRELSLDPRDSDIHFFDEIFENPAEAAAEDSPAQSAEKGADGGACFSFADNDHVYNVAPILTAQVVSSEILSANTVRSLTYNPKPHPYAVFLPTRCRPWGDNQPAGAADEDRRQPDPVELGTLEGELMDVPVKEKKARSIAKPKRQVPREEELRDDSGVGAPQPSQGPTTEQLCDVSVAPVEATRPCEHVSSATPQPHEKSRAKAPQAPTEQEQPLPISKLHCQSATEASHASETAAAAPSCGEPPGFNWSSVDFEKPVVRIVESPAAPPQHRLGGEASGSANTSFTGVAADLANSSFSASHSPPVPQKTAAPRRRGKSTTAIKPEDVDL